MNNWLELWQETISYKFQNWVDEVDENINILSDYCYGMEDITKSISIDLWDEETKRSRFVTYDRDWMGERFGLIVHPAFTMWKSGLETRESAKFLLDEFKSENVNG